MKLNFSTEIKVHNMRTVHVSLIQALIKTITWEMDTQLCGAALKRWGSGQYTCDFGKEVHAFKRISWQEVTVS